MEFSSIIKFYKEKGESKVALQICACCAFDLFVNRSCDGDHHEDHLCISEFYD